MRKLLYTILGVLMMSACGLETSDNGDLDGYWQLTSIDTLSTGGSCDMRSTLIFWAVQNKLLEMRDNTGSNQSILFRFEHTTDSLILSEPIIDNRDSSDIQLNDYSVLRPYGIYNVPESLYVNHLSGSTMILTSPYFRLNFRKY